eukprot:m.344443 g.344443  ORF g.344443 m.344443 type:complete len:324 (-) comp24477_c0_seq1:1579-2550(-)
MTTYPYNKFSVPMAVGPNIQLDLYTYWSSFYLTTSYPFATDYPSLPGYMEPFYKTKHSIITIHEGLYEQITGPELPVQVNRHFTSKRVVYSISPSAAQQLADVGLKLGKLGVISGIPLKSINTSFEVHVTVPDTGDTRVLAHITLLITDCGEGTATPTCKNNGVCSDLGLTAFDMLFSCSCPAGFSGPACNIAVVPPTPLLSNISNHSLVGTLNFPLASLHMTPAPGSSITHIEEWTLQGNLSCGLILDALAGTLQGTPVVPGRYIFSIFGKDKQGRLAEVDSEHFDLTINDCSGDFSCNGGRCIDNVQYDSKYVYLVAILVQ